MTVYRSHHQQDRPVVSLAEFCAGTRFLALFVIWAISTLTAIPVFGMDTQALLVGTLTVILTILAMDRYPSEMSWTFPRLKLPKEKS